jgi:hypothetical protein
MYNQKNKFVMFICPQPQIWHEIYQKLETAWKAQGRVGNEPPRPLILGGWNFSNDLEKKRRWEETLKWAKENNLEYLISEISSDDSYFVENPNDKPINPMGGPMYLPWNFSPKVRPTDEVIQKALQLLKDNWVQIIGQELGLVTSPIRFTGRCRRRLLASARADYEPPWGEWDTLYNEPFRSHFRVFRRAVNKAIAPHHVDHIDFEVTDEL